MTSRPRVIAYLVASPGDLINLVAIASVFSYPKVGGKPAYAAKILSMQAETEVRSRDGLTVSHCVPCAEYSGPIDTLVVIGGESAFAEPSPAVVQWIRERLPALRRVVSVCTGAFVLAATGALDGKRLTTHWHHAHRLAKQYPKLLIDKEPIFVKDGNVYSTAGVTAGIDMALALVEEDLGRAAAASIAHTLVLYVRRSGAEAQYSTLLAQQSRRERHSAARPACLGALALGTAARCRDVGQCGGHDTAHVRATIRAALPHDPCTLGASAARGGGVCTARCAGAAAQSHLQPDRLSRSTCAAAGLFAAAFHDAEGVPGALWSAAECGYDNVWCSASAARDQVDAACCAPAIL
jgi:putative intracellular protease/amidase